MARYRSKRKRHNRDLETLQEKATVACAIGVAALLAPALLGNTTILGGIFRVLQPLGWFALLGGMALFGIHHLTKGKQPIAAPMPTPKPRPPTPKELEVLRDIRDDILNEPRSFRIIEPTVRSNPRSWSPAVFSAIEWRRFEAVCEKLFAQAGFETKSQSHGADGGVDIWLYSRNAEGPVAVVQCKHWQGKAVGVKELREFFGVMASNQLKRGTYATSSTYTADAQQFAKDNGINAMNGAGLLALIAKRTPEQQQELLDVAYQGEYWRPTCASCGTKMVERAPAKGGAKFWGCSNYPKCKSRLRMAAARK